MEDFSGCGSGCRIATGTEDFLGGSLTNPAVPHPYREAQRSCVHFERHAVLGADIAIMPGVTLGEGVSVGAKSLLLEDCERWTVYVGSPARPLRPRPKEKILELKENAASMSQRKDYPSVIQGLRRTKLLGRSFMPGNIAIQFHILIFFLRHASTRREKVSALRKAALMPFLTLSRKVRQLFSS